MNANPPLISIVVLNWNGMQVVERCLQSLQQQTYQALEIIVVDNASSDESVDLVRKKYLNIKLIVNERNLGFGGIM
jgi:glycosyltransferase involved in cell wall biosynthesis